MPRTVRIVGATMVCALAMALISSLPAVGSAAFLPLLGFNTVISATLFVVCGTISHAILRWKRWTRLRAYAGVMFAVATVVLALVQLTLLQWIFGQGGSEYHSGTQIIENGRFTAGGLVTTLVEAIVGAVWLTVSFAFFWRMTVRSRE